MEWRPGFFVLIFLLVLAGCASRDKDKPMPVLMTPGSRLIYHDGDGNALWTICDRGNRVYMTHAGVYQVVPNGCPDGQP